MNGLQSAVASKPLQLAVFSLAILAAAGSIGCREQTPVAGLSLVPQQVELDYPGASVVELSWTPSAPAEPAEGGLMVFVHLLDAESDVVRTFDHPFPRDWRIGDAVDYEVELFQSALGPPLEPGEYDLSVGLYDLSGQRWPLATAGEEVDEGEYVLAVVKVPEGPGSPTPDFQFSQSWSLVEGGSDIQILGRRRFNRQAEMRIAGASGAGRVWLLLRIPPYDADSGYLIMQDDARVPAVTLTSDCGDFEAEISGGGQHRVEVPVVRQEDGSLMAECQIRFIANFRSSIAEAAVSLEGLGWIPD